MPPKDKDLLDNEAAKQVEQMGSVDILVGTPSFNNARAISHLDPGRTAAFVLETAPYGVEVRIEVAGAHEACKGRFVERGQAKKKGQWEVNDVRFS